MDVKIDNTGKTETAFLSRMDRSDWIFFMSYFILVIVIAFISDLILHIVDGRYIILSGNLLGMLLFRNRVLRRTSKKK